MRRKPFHTGRIKTIWLLLSLCAAALGCAAAVYTKREIPTAYYDVQLAAAARMEQASAVLLETLLSEGISIEQWDVNRTGLIGPEFTAITTTLGALEAKRTVLNPNFAALFVRYFIEAGLERGDVVAIGVSGSFPGLAIAVLCAANEMGLETRVIASYGSSTYGATRPELTITKMYRVLREAGLAEYTLLAVSPGGDNDHGENILYLNARDILSALAEDDGVEYIDFTPPDIERSIHRRLELYGDIDVFVNIGGASPNSGTSAYTLNFPNGLVKGSPKIPAAADRGLVYEYAARGVPVINMLNIRGLAAENGLPYDPVPMPSPGSGGVYYAISYNIIIIMSTLLSSVVFIFIGARKQQKHRNG